MKQKNIFLLLLVAFLGSSAYAQTNNDSQWRGEQRNGLYNETGLLKKWNINGPDLIWKYDGLGEGHSSVAISAGKIYVTGLAEDKGKLFVFDTSGKLMKEKVYGEEWDKSYDGPRSTITINDGLLYLYSAFGKLMCLNSESLEEVWSSNVISSLSGSNIYWGVTESPLIVGNRVIITPGGKKNNVIALNKKTGDVIWTSKALGEKAAYCSPLYIDMLETQLIVTVTSKNIIGINSNSGELLWSYLVPTSYNIQANTPLFAGNNMIFFSNSSGSVMLKLKNNGRAVEKLWENKKFNNYMGGFVVLGDYIYGAGDRKNPWLCLDKNSGEIKYSSKILRAPGNIISADGMLYCYSDRGEVALVNPTPLKFDIISKFKIIYGTKQNWAHPVIKNGILYIRHGNTLMAYRIK